MTSSSPAPVAKGASARAESRSSCRDSSIGGHTYRRMRLASSRRVVPRSAWPARMLSRQAASVRSTAGNATTWSEASRSGVTSRTSATATRRSSAGLSGATQWNRYVSSVEGSRVPSKFFSRHKSRR